MRQRGQVLALPPGVRMDELEWEDRPTKTTRNRKLRRAAWRKWLRQSAVHAWICSGQKGLMTKEQMENAMSYFEDLRLAIMLAEADLKKERSAK